VFKLVQAETIDRDFKMIQHLHSTVALGHLNYTEAKGNKAKLCEWKIRASEELEMFVPRIAKYLIIKGAHFKRSLEWWRTIRGSRYSQEELSWFRENLKQSRADSGPLKPKNYPSAAWLAGYLDGDGCLYLGERQKMLTISFHKDDIVAPQLIQKAFGGNIYTGLWKNSPDVCQYRLTLGGKNSLNPTGRKLLQYVVPHLRIKKHNAELLLALH
jgi:hypothetical protein